VNIQDRNTQGRFLIHNTYRAGKYKGQENTSFLIHNTYRAGKYKGQENTRKFPYT
jgi:hypothetical protein